ncbi:hypothetical protein KR222_000863 [Zaprionus bogoriensis]|nr:hypothetical protein KR222_000863 [Zaprionus bogoriensis]
MAGKRQATSNLNHTNWDQEEEPEERGTFKTAPPEELKTRVIKKATRRKVAGAGGADGDEAATSSPSANVFSGFSGFGKPAASSTAGAAAPFSFLTKVPPAPLPGADTTAKPAASIEKDDAKKTPSSTKWLAFDSNAKNDSKTSLASSWSNPTVKTSSAATSIFGNATASEPTTAPPKAPMSMFKAAVTPSANSSDSSVSQEYLSSVAELNMAVMKFLQEHMDKNPYCILSPVFSSYEKHLKQIQQKDGPTSSAAPAATTQSGATPTATATVTATASAPANTMAAFSFGKPTTSTSGAIGSNSSSSSSSSVGFGKKPNCTVTSGGTTTTVTAPLFSFGNVQKTSSSPAKSEAASGAASSPATSIFSFGVKPSPTAAGKEDAPKPSFFSFGAKETSSSDANAATSPPKTNGFSFGFKSDDKPSTSGFAGFGKAASDTKIPATTGFSFGIANAMPPAAAASEAAADEEEDKPPVVEFKQVVEDDATFSKRCKVFVKKDKEFTDRGVGTLYLKPVKDSEKTQMLVRADTNLGNILVNLILAEGIPCQRMGKNNVMMVCIPTPEETKPLSILLRVKTGDEADELLEQIKKHTV